MHVLLGVTAGIAAYKIPLLVRLLIKQGHEVRVIMTPDSTVFVSPLVLSTLSKNPVAIEFWDKKTGEWNHHVAYAEWADVLVVAPCTANTLAKMSQGLCDNFLLATFLSMRNRTMIAPAMDLEMYQHPSVRRNLTILEEDGVIIIPAEHGELASGMVGEGRLPEPERLAEHINRQLGCLGKLNGVKALVTAGPTYEAIDAVRFIGNRSSGKMGYAIAEALANQGAQVTLLSGPTHLSIKHPFIQRVEIESAHDLFLAVQQYWSNSDLGIFAAAVADYRPSEPHPQKIKKNENSLSLNLFKTEDSLAWAGSQKKAHQFLMGFALETNDGDTHAKEKLHKKNLDAVVLNVLGENGVGFNFETNKIRIFGIKGQRVDFPLESKTELAKKLVGYIIENK
jgi:phosphopantothenoylcysteine decarboxylase/phosphopantothenate--cysteine ligase